MKAIVSDFGGVLTTPLTGAFEALHQDTGISLEQFAATMKRIAEADGEHPLFELERGKITELQFAERAAAVLTDLYGGEWDLTRFGEIFFRGLAPNTEMIELMFELRDAGHRTALLTNNVREWQPRWRSMLPVDEIFELVVDSAFAGYRKPEPEIYELTLEGLGMQASDCVFIDDMPVNCEGAAALGFHTVHFQDNPQAIAEIRGAIG